MSKIKNSVSNIYNLTRYTCINQVERRSQLSKAKFWIELQCVMSTLKTIIDIIMLLFKIDSRQGKSVFFLVRIEITKQKAFCNQNT